MAGTFSDQATLAQDVAFINKVRAAMLFRAVELTTSESPQTLDTLQKMDSILQSAGGQAPSLAWLVATGNATIAAAAPAVPSDGDVQFVVNTFLSQF